MTEELKTEELVSLPIEEQISQELVKHNYTEAKLQEFEEYLKLDIIDDDKESYLIIKDKRKEVKSYRVAVEKFCKFKREDAVKIQKAWVANENKLVAILSKVEDHLEAKEKAYEKKIAEEKEARKRKQEEQLIIRQQTLTNMGALYSDGNFTLGEVSFELSLVKESEEDIWQETIFPKFYEEYNKIELDRMAEDRKRQEAEDELKRQHEELEVERKRLSAEADRLKAEKDRQELEAAKRRSDQFEFRSQQLKSIGFDVHGVEWYVFREFKIAMSAVWDWDDNAWGLQLVSAKQYVDQVLAEEAEEKRKQQEITDLQNKRYTELLPYSKYGEPVEMGNLWIHAESGFQEILSEKRGAFEKAEEERKKQIEEAAAKKERERIEEEQRQAKLKREQATGKARFEMLGAIDVKTENQAHLGTISDEEWMVMYEAYKKVYDKTQHDKWVSDQEIIRKQEEERKAEELLQASEKEKWQSMMDYLNGMVIHSMRSSQYRKKVAILREKLEEIKAL